MEFEGEALQAPFDMKATIARGDEAADAVRYGEYRQHISGAYLEDGEAAVWQIGAAAANLALSDAVVEDRNEAGGLYGHRTNPWSAADGYVSGWVHNQAAGPRYSGHDPSSRRATTKTSMRTKSRR